MFTTGLKAVFGGMVAEGGDGGFTGDTTSPGRFTLTFRPTRETQIIEYSSVHTIK